MPVRLLRLMPRVPLPEVVTGTVQVMPLSLVVGVPMLAPAVAGGVPVRMKLAALTPLTAWLKVTVKSTVASLLGLGLARTNDWTTGAL